MWPPTTKCLLGEVHGFQAQHGNTALRTWLYAHRVDDRGGDRWDFGGGGDSGVPGLRNTCARDGGASASGERQGIGGRECGECAKQPGGGSRVVAGYQER